MNAPTLPPPRPNTAPLYILLRSTKPRTVDPADPALSEHECWDRHTARRILARWLTDPTSAGTHISVDACYPEGPTTIHSSEVP